MEKRPADEFYFKRGCLTKIAISELLDPSKDYRGESPRIDASRSINSVPPTCHPMPLHGKGEAWVGTE